MEKSLKDSKGTGKPMHKLGSIIQWPNNEQVHWLVDFFFASDGVGVEGVGEDKRSSIKQDGSSNSETESESSQRSQTGKDFEMVTKEEVEVES